MATHADAEILLKLYDLRREVVCREARKFFISWNPKDEAEIRRVVGDTSLPENAYVRQATTYWEMAFSIANLGALDAELLARNCGEGIIFALKCQHLAKKFPEAWTRRMPEAEAFIAANATAGKKAQAMASRFS